ncbi:MAG: hypothetical protein ACR2MK_00680 [Solirubrobacteraceae bacterium]
MGDDHARRARFGGNPPVVELISAGKDGRASETGEGARKSGHPMAAIAVRYIACLITIVTNVNVAVPALPVTCQQPPVGKMTPLD